MDKNTSMKSQLQLSKETYCEPYLFGRGQFSHCTQVNRCCKTCPEKDSCPIPHGANPCKYSNLKCPFEISKEEMAMRIFNKQVFGE